MKKLLLLSVLLTMYSLLYSQSEAINYVSMGFNTFFDPRFHEGPSYYFYGYDGYSEAIIDHRNILFLSKNIPGHYISGHVTTPFDEDYEQYQGKNGSTGYSRFRGASSHQGVEYIFEGGNLIYWQLSHDLEPSLIVNKIEQTSDKITIFANYISRPGGKENKYEYYNIDKKELLDLFLKRYIETICSIVNNLDGYYKINFDNWDNKENSDIIKILRGRTKNELSIFRNCLFALKGYKFSSQTWTDFFKNYLDGYNGLYTNDEVISNFTENEKWLLDLIIKQENR